MKNLKNECQPIISKASCGRGDETQHEALLHEIPHRLEDSCQLFVTINASKHIIRRQCRMQMNDKYFNRNRMTS